MKRATVALVALLCLVAFVPAYAETYTANFDSDSESWNEGATSAAWYASGGQDGGGFHTNTRNSPYSAYLTPPITSVMFGDVAGNFGDMPISFSYYRKDISNTLTTIPKLYVFADVNGGGWDIFWSYQPEGIGMQPEWNGIPKDWTQYAYTIDPTADEAPAGWTPNNTSYTWAESWQHITSWNFCSGNGTGMPNITGIDTVCISSVPEPTTIVLLLGGMLMLPALRRR